MISTVASHSDTIEAQHITNTSCERIDSTTRRLQPSLGTNTTVVYADVPMMERFRQLRDWAPNKTVEIAIDLLAPAKNSETLGSLVVADLDKGITNGTFLAMLMELSAALNVTMFEYANVKDAYLIRQDPKPKQVFLIQRLLPRWPPRPQSERLVRPRRRRQFPPAIRCRSFLQCNSYL